MGLIEGLPAGRTAVDTAPFIYYIEQHPRYHDIVKPLFEAAATGKRELDRPVLRSAARLRAVHGMRTPDALQIAAALSRGCSAFVTNDRRLPSIAGLRILQLSDFTE